MIQPFETGVVRGIHVRDGDTVNAGARLESLAPVGGVLIGAQTYDRLPDGTLVEERSGLRVKGKDDVVNAYVLLALP